MKVLIATAKGPSSEEGFNAICDAFRGVARGEDCSITSGIWWTGGRGCSNVAFEIDGDEDNIEKVAHMLTMALMPSKWSYTDDAIPEEDTNDLL